MKRLFLTYILTLLAVTIWADEIDLKQVYRQLDKAIERSDEYVRQREKRIQRYKMASGVTDDSRVQ